MLQKSLFIIVFLAFNNACSFSIIFGIRKQRRIEMSQLRPPLQFGNRFDHVKLLLYPDTVC